MFKPKLTDPQKDLLLAAGDYESRRMEVEDCLDLVDHTDHAEINKLIRQGYVDYRGRDQPPCLTPKGYEAYYDLAQSREQQPPLRASEALPPLELTVVDGKPQFFTRRSHEQTGPAPDSPDRSNQPPETLTREGAQPSKPFSAFRDAAQARQHKRDDGRER